MEKQPRLMLSNLWDDMEGSQKAEILKHVVEFEKIIYSVRFTKFGSLYYKHDLPQSDSTTPLYVDRNGNVVHSAEFEIGPTNHRSFFDFGKGVLDIDRGPWSTLKEHIAAIAYREIACVEKGHRYPKVPEGLFYGPRQYQPSALTKLCSLNNYLKIAPYVLPEEEVTYGSVLWHGDVHTQNFFVDPENPARILGIIDWQAFSAWPLFMQVTCPDFLNFNGPSPRSWGQSASPATLIHYLRTNNARRRPYTKLRRSTISAWSEHINKNPDAFLAMQ